ncbi:MAG: cbb3-type cytochrome c oxidase subunit I [Actinomycetota bacterium]|nr:cbb3-type cytochrome c oxidase subunit I [Actinomycetota bacterium]
MSVQEVLGRPRATLLETVAGTDHKSLGLAVTATSLAFFALGGLLALVMRAELAHPGLQVVDADAYNQLFTIHGSTMLFLFAPTVVFGLALYMVPLQLGAAGVMWPRLASVAYWLYLGGGLIMWSGFLVENGAAKAGWHAFYPLTDANQNPWMGMDFWIVGVVLSQAAVLAWAVCLLATIVRRRAPGMTLWRMSFFTWSMVATIFMVVTTFPVLLAAMALLFVDRHGITIFGLPGGAVTWQYLFWFYAHPLVYVIFFPVMAVVAETIATFSRRRQFGYRTSVVAVLTFAALSSSVWGHHMFTQQDVDNRYFSFTTTSIAVPAGIEYFSFIATMWGGRIRLRAPMLFALGFAVLFLIGGLSGIFVASPPIDYDVHDTYVVVAHFHYTVFGGTVWGLMTALYLWFPKVTGRMLDEGLARWHAGLMFVGSLATFFPWFFLGMLGMRREIADYGGWHAGWTTWNMVSTAGSAVLFVSLVVFAVNVVRSLRRGAPAGPDPWDGQTLEWATSSPPPPHNFEALAPVRSHAPLLDLREAQPA